MIKQEARKPRIQKRHRTIRLKLSGDAQYPRLAVYRSTKHIYAQIIDDVKHVTLVAASSNDKELRAKLSHGGNIDAAKAVGEKSIEMIKSKELLPLTGYIHGGCSPIGMKKYFKTTIDESVLDCETFCISAGKIGYQIEISLAELKKVIRVDTAKLTVGEK